MLFSPNLDNFTNLWPNLLPEQLQAMEKNTIQAAKPSTSETHCRVKEYNAKKRARKEKGTSKKDRQASGKNPWNSHHSHHRVANRLEKKGKILIITPRTIDLTANEPPAKRVKIV